MLSKAVDLEDTAVEDIFPDLQTSVATNRCMLLSSVSYLTLANLQCTLWGKKNPPKEEEWGDAGIGKILSHFIITMQNRKQWWDTPHQYIGKRQHMMYEIYK